MQQLQKVFGELGITQYLDSFIDQGFDSWDTVLDITEADLDVLGVKLGHRRKLQRRIANTRGVSAEISLGPVKRPIEDASKQEAAQRQEVPRHDSRDQVNLVITKRKYRRHPKPDENAPERPPSAYVLFSNKMREDLKGRNLTFTEIAKLVGENWQSLSPAEKEPYESHAQALKDTYQANLAEYRKKPEYKKYIRYLADFKAKHTPSSQDKEMSKRIKLADSGVMSSNSTNATPNRTSRSGSGSSHRGSEPPPSQQQRLGSVVSTGESAQNPASMTPASFNNAMDDMIDSPKTVTTDLHSERSPTFSTSPTEATAFPGRREPNRPEDQRMEQRADQPPVHRHLPSFSDVFDGPGRLPSIAHPTNVNSYPFPRSHTSPGPPPGLINGENRPSLRHEQSSSASTSSSASSYGFPRTPTDNTLPIHSLLASNPAAHHPFESGPHQQAVFQPRGPPPSIEHKHPYSHHQTPNGMGHPIMNGYHSTEPSVPYGAPGSGALNGSTTTESGYVNGPSSVAGGPPPTPQQNPSQGSSNKKQQDANLDGMSALLKAGEIVDRRAQ